MAWLTSSNDILRFNRSCNNSSPICGFKERRNLSPRRQYVIYSAAVISSKELV